jgi:hypothetical protein
MNRLRRLLLPMIIAGLMALSGCAAHIQTFKQVDNLPADKAVIYIYNVGGANHSLFPLAIWANDKEITLLKKGSYYPYVAEPGAIDFIVRYMGVSSLVVDTNPGQTYYLKVGITKGLSSVPTLVLVAPEVAAQEIASCKLMPKKK